VGGWCINNMGFLPGVGQLYGITNNMGFLPIHP
jgi:hypothetical protein